MKLALLSLLLAATFLSGKDKDQGLSISLISENKVLAAGQPFAVGVHIQHDPEFHTYWKNPGIVGIPTMLDWELPEGFTASEISWPYPEQCDMVGHPCFGYERDILLLITITPPKDQRPSGELKLKASANWMCCARTCYPGFKEFSLTVPVAKTAEPDQALTPLFKKSREETPQISKAWKLEKAVLSEDGEFTLSFKGPSKEKPIYYFSSDRVFSSDQKQSFQPSGEGSWTLVIAPSNLGPKNHKSLAGVLHTESGHHGLFLPDTPAARR